MTWWYVLLIHNATIYIYAQYTQDIKISISIIYIYMYLLSLIHEETVAAASYFHLFSIKDTAKHFIV